MEELRDNGKKIGLQSLGIVRIFLRMEDHVSVEKLHANMKTKFSRMSLAPSR